MNEIMIESVPASLTFGGIIGFILFLGIFAVVFYKFWHKAKREVPPEAQAKMEALENVIERSIRDLKNKIKD